MQVDLTGIMLDECTGLHVFTRGSVRAVKYRDDILDPYVYIFRGAVGTDFILMDNNGGPHRADKVDIFLEKGRYLLDGVASHTLVLGRVIASRHTAPSPSSSIHIV